MSLVSSILARVKEKPLAQSIEEKPAFSPEKITHDDIVAKTQAALQSMAENDLETEPRSTVLRMLRDTDLEELFVFKTMAGGGANYVQAMRQVLSRTRGKANKKKVLLDRWKLFQLSIKEQGEFDVVTLIRSTRLTAKEESVYDELTDLLIRKAKGTE